MKIVSARLYWIVVLLICCQNGIYSQIILEAEKAYYSSGIVENEYSGYTGTGYVNTVNASGEYVEWFINITDSVTNNLDFRYALGKDEHRTMEIYINNVLKDTIDFDNTTTFTNYQYKTIVAKLHSGLNSIKAIAINEQGPPNMDHLRIYADTIPLPFFKLSLTTDGNGTVTSVPDIDSAQYGTRIIATATNNPGYSFNSWSGSFSEGSNPLIFMVDKDCSIQANFVFSLPAFPGAEGFAQFVTGGRGGAVYEVTNLDDSGVGSLRWAINQSGKRTIVFRVSGTIHLSDELKINNGDLTIAGQTAPGDGITLANQTLTIEANNVIIRYIRSRLGDVALAINDALNGRNQQNIILDHCTMSWSVDEIASFYDNTNFTMQYCLMSESLYNSVHNKGQHGYTGIWGGKGATFHHNLIANSYSRNPRFCGSRYSNQASLELVDFRNNVIYNWGGNSGYAGEGGRYNMVNNYYKYGPATGSSVRDRIFEPYQDDGTNMQAAGIWGLFYVNGNYVNKYPSVTADNWLGIDPNPSSKAKSELKSDTEFEVDSVTTQTAEIAFEHVLAQAGASLPKRDTLDMRIVREAMTGTTTYGGTYGASKGIIDTQTDVGGWPVLNSTTPPTDTDKDGMPDEWETAHGLNSSDATDRNGDDDKDGYTNLEEYLNELVAEYTYIIRPLNFNVQKSSDSIVTITWDDMVENETGFIIERSTGNGFEVIATTSANSTAYQDIVSEYGKFTYRMRAINATDTSFCTDTISVSFITSVNMPGEILNNVSIFPNPSEKELNISFNISNLKDIKIGLYDITGNLITEILDESFGNLTYKMNTEGFPAGIYYIVLEVDGITKPVKFVKL